MRLFNIPSPPTQEDDFSYLWRSWLYKATQAIKGVTEIPWAALDFVGSNITDLETRNHADLQNLNTTNYTHLTETQYVDLTDGGDTTLHKHDADRDRANHTGTQLLATISDAGTAASQSGLSVTVALAKLTGGGTDGSLTFTNGVLTGKVDPT